MAAVAAARAKEDELRAELKWRISEKSAAERAAAEVAARHELAKEALQQAEKQCAEAGAEAAQKQALMGQLMELEASMQKQGQLVEEAKQEAQKAKTEAAEGGKAMDGLRQELNCLQALYSREKSSVQTLHELTRKQAEDLKNYDEVLLEAQKSRGQLQALNAHNEGLQENLRSHKAEQARLAESLEAKAQQLLEATSRETRMSGQLSALREALVSAQDDAAALRARLSSRAPVQPQPPVSPPPVSQPAPSQPAQPSQPVKLIQPVEAVQSRGLEGNPLGMPAQTRDMIPSAAFQPDKGTHAADDFPETQVDAEGDTKRRRTGDVLPSREASFVPVAPAPPPRISMAPPMPALAPMRVPLSPPAPEPMPRNQMASTRQQAEPRREVPTPAPSISSLGVRDLKPATPPSSPRCTPLGATRERARARPRSKEEVERLAHSMFSSKPLAKQLRGPPLKLYQAHIDYVLSNWDKYDAPEKQPRQRCEGRENRESSGAWLAVQNFLQSPASTGESPGARARCIVSRAR
ncbi:unnamed protein product [Effrenium voratum]|uniref:Uncharacterized protein n=1 Tax=Effrenium voratum TaxID=2562239 RepID=A0AA36J6E4_9DINO|nr:unnamed protein product [Effrenium voratum]CAJ1458152.1 unnamed protein product [Effrenium voratum]